LDENPIVLKEKKKWTLRLRRKSMSVAEAPVTQPLKGFHPSLHSASRTNIGPDQTAKIQAAAAALRQQQADSQYTNMRQRNPRVNAADGKTNSVFTLQPVIMSEATPAMKWANRYDRDTLRDAYLNGTPMPEKKPIPPKKPEVERMLPAIPKEEPVQTSADVPGPIMKKEPVAPSADAVNNASSPLPISNGRASPAFNKLNAGSTPSVGSAPEKSKKVSRLRAMFGKKAEGLIPVPSGHLDASQKLNRGSPAKKHFPIELNVTMETAPVAVESEEKSPLPTPMHQTLEPPQQRQAADSFVSSVHGPIDDETHQAHNADDSPEISEIDTRFQPTAAKDDDVESEGSLPNSYIGSPAPVQDRWAQIRKNAAERAKVQTKVSDDVSATTTEARGSMDDGETSGEESRF
jgi:hypothetical protein